MSTSPHGPPGLEGEQRDALGPHRVGHVRPRAVDALGGERLAGVDLGVEDLQGLVGDADLVGIGIAERDQAGGLGLSHLVGLAADVPGRLLHRLQHRLDLLVKQRRHGAMLPVGGGTQVPGTVVTPFNLRDRPATGG
jgi:hypothetical protein